MLYCIALRGHHTAEGGGGTTQGASRTCCAIPNYSIFQAAFYTC